MATDTRTSSPLLTRRQLLQASLKTGLAVGVSGMLTPAFATFQLTPYIAGSRRDDTVKTLAFLQTHTGETLKATFYAGGMYDDDALKRINFILRDFRSGDEMPMDLDLLDLLYDIKAGFDTKEPFHIISGYRCPETNAMLAAKSEGVDKNSFHMQGQAIDIRIPGVKTKSIRDMAIKMERGGVGYYVESDFVHVDTGPVRKW